MNVTKRFVLALLAACAMVPLSAEACPYHLAGGNTAATGSWPTIGSSGPAALARPEALDVTVTGWLQNTTNLRGRSTDTTIHAAVSSIAANVQQVRYTSSKVYVNATSIPDYNIGPFGGNPNVPANANATFAIPRTPQPATGTHTATNLGAIGVLLNGVQVFNISDSRSYQNQNVWHNNAGYVESPSFDVAGGHPQQQGVYHNHQRAPSLETELGASSTSSRLLGYAIDGYPIYNGYAATTAGGPLVKMTSGYKLRTYTNNVRGNGGPNVAGMYVNGYFQEDYQWTQQTLPAGKALLDEYNGAFVYTPEYPQGIYAYFTTTDDAGAAAYPYIVGPSYYGTPNSENFAGNTIVVPADAVLYTVPEPAAISTFSAGLMLLAGRRRR